MLLILGLFAATPLRYLDENDGDGGDASGGTGTAAPVATGGDDADLTEFLTAVDQRVETAVAPVRAENETLRTQNAELKGRIDQITEVSQHHQQQRNRLFGGNAPGVRSGEDPLTSRGFSFQRALGYVQGMQEFDDEQTKVEREFCQRLRRYYCDQHGLQTQGAMINGRAPLLVPLGAEMLPEELTSDLQQNYGDVRQFLTEGVSGADAGGIGDLANRVSQQYRGQVNQAASMFDDTALGLFTGSGPWGEMIDLIRPREVVSRVGATSVTLPPNGHLAFPKQTGSGVGYWVGENETITGSDQSTGTLELRAKMAAAMVTLPGQLLKFATQNIEAFVRADIARVLALLVDLAALEGAGTTTQPLGILNHDGILTHTASMTLATDGNTFDPNTPASMIADVEEENHDVDGEGFAFLMRSKMWKNLRTRRTDAVAEGDEAGQFLFDINRADIAKGAGAMLEGHPVYKSGQVSRTRTKGASSDLTYVLGGIWKHLLVARVGVIEFAMATQGDTTFAKYQTKLRAIQFCDMGLRYENAFVIADQIDMDLT